MALFQTQNPYIFHQQCESNGFGTIINASNNSWQFYILYKQQWWCYILIMLWLGLASKNNIFSSLIQFHSLMDESYEEVEEAVSPPGQYFNSSVICSYVFGFLEMAIPIDDSKTIPLIKDVFLPINPRFSSIMVLFSSILYSFYNCIYIYFGNIYFCFLKYHMLRYTNIIEYI